MNILVTLGPTQEPLDAMRIISNRSTGELGTKLALKLIECGHHVITLRGAGSTFPITPLLEKGGRVIPFTTTENLRVQLTKLAQEESIDAVFHAAAISDFYLPGGGSGKIPTSNGSLHLTLETTPKLLPLMSGWFPRAKVTGWKFESSDILDCKNTLPSIEKALNAGASQISKCGIHACVVNGPSYGSGFGVLGKSGTLTHLDDRDALCDFLVKNLE
jgi:phosphopantothenoylcysteine decarboxylase/phosphopantothenate--cysteine ligase